MHAFEQYYTNTQRERERERGHTMAMTYEWGRERLGETKRFTLDIQWILVLKSLASSWNKKEKEKKFGKVWL